MRIRIFIFATLCVLLALVLAPQSAAFATRCIEIHKYSSTGLLNLDTGDYTQQDGLQIGIHPSPDGQYTLRQTYADSQQVAGITITSNLTGQVVQTIADIVPPIQLQEGRWATDSRRIAFLSSYLHADRPAESRLTVVDIPGGVIQAYTFDDVSYGSLGTWSADGAYLDLTLSRDIDHHLSIFLEAESGRTIPFPVPWAEALASVWSPGGHRMAILRETTAANQELILFEPDRGVVAVAEMPVRVRYILSLLYAPGGAHLAVYGNFNCDPEGHNCDIGAVVFGRDGSSPRIIPGSIYAMPEWRALWSGADGVWLALQPSQAPPVLTAGDAWAYRDLVAYDLAGELSDIVQRNVIVPDYLADIPGTTGGYSGVMASYFSPDGSRLFMIYEEAGTIRLDLADATGQHRQTMLDRADSLALYNALGASYPCTACLAITIAMPNPTWIGNRLLVRWQSGQDAWLSWFNADGIARHDLPEAAHIGSISVLPGDRYLMYVDSRVPGIGLLDLETGQENLVYRSPSGEPVEMLLWYAVLSPDQQWVVLHVGGAVNRLLLIALSDLRVQDVVLGGAFLAGPSWSPDSRDLAFLQSGPDHINVEIVSPYTDQTRVFAAGLADFWFPREFISHAGVMTWRECP